MSRGPTTFRQRDVSAAIKAATAAGATVLRVELDKDGRIVLVLANGKQCNAEPEAAGNEWDAVLK